MPEGHTIHRAALDQRKMLVGQALEVSSPQGRFSAGAEELNGQTCTAIEAYGKHLFCCFQFGIAVVTVDNKSKSKTRYGERVNIFAKETCPACNSEIRKFEMAARRVFSCDTCQVPPEI